MSPTPSDPLARSFEPNRGGRERTNGNSAPILSMLRLTRPQPAHITTAACRSQARTERHFCVHGWRLERAIGADARSLTLGT
jgi:hypothetical protein